jgi:hypothetical protein
MGLGRTWRLRERMTLNIRAEFYNVFNRAYRSNPSSTNFQAPQNYQKNATPLRAS